MSLFAALAQISLHLESRPWHDMFCFNTKCIKMRLQNTKCNLGEVAGVTGSFWDHARIILKSAVPCNGRFTRFLSYLGASLFRVSVIFGEVAVRLFASGTVLGEIWNDCWSTKCSMFMFNTKCIPKARKMTRRWRSDGLILRITLGSVSLTFRNRKDVSATSFLVVRGTCSNWWNEVSIS